MLMRYKTFDHTADLGVEVYGEDQKHLFSNAGFALFDLISGADAIEVKTSLDLTVEEMNLDDLMVNWLRELLYLHQSERYLFRDFIIHEIDEKVLRATLKGEKCDPLRYELIREIKAVTYHQNKVIYEKGRWVSRIVFDI